MIVRVLATAYAVAAVLVFLALMSVGARWAFAT
jgi:hypothetical protein